ncbi:MAG: inositol monophosphatase family protein [Halohasta sp.]
MTESADSRAAVAERAATAGAEFAVEQFRTGIAAESKATPTDFVTEADRGAQKRVIEEITAAYPGEPIVGEEDDAPKTVPADGPAWIVDPIDGTNNFVNGIRLWGTAVAAVVDAEPVAASVVLPAVGDTYTADAETASRNGSEIEVSDVEKPELATVAPTLWWDRDHRDDYAAMTGEIVHRFDDLRRFGSAQATLAMVADGSIEAVVSDLRAPPWDSVAGVHLVRTAGGTATDVDGERWRHDSQGLVVSNNDIHEAAQAAVEGVVDR